MNYQIYDIHDENGDKIEYVTGAYGNIMLELNGDGKEHRIYIEYHEPLFFRISEIISIISFMYVCIFLFYNKIRALIVKGQLKNV
jgi:hypothetical protein